MDAMKLIDSLPRRRPAWQSLFVLLLSLSTVPLWGQAPRQTEDDWIVLANPVLFPGSGSGKVRAVFELAYKEEGMSNIIVDNVVLLVGQPGVAAPRTQIDYTFPYQMATNRAPILAEHYFDREYLVSTTTAGLKAQFRLSGSYFYAGKRFKVDYLGPVMDVPGNGNTGTLIVNSKIWDPESVGEYRLPTAEEIAGSQGVELNRAVVAKMDANGRMSISLAPGDYEFYAFAEGRRSIPEVVRVVKDEVVSVEVILDEGKEFWNPLIVKPNAAVEGIISSDFSTVTTINGFHSTNSGFSLIFSSFGKPFDVGTPDNLKVRYQDENGNQVESVQDLFIKGPFTHILSVSSTKRPALQSIFAKAKGSPITLSGDVSGQGFHFEFRVGTRKVQGKLQAPPSRPSLSVANQTVAVWLVGQQVTLVATTDRNGNFQLPVLVPEGVAANLQVTVVGSDGVNFHGSAAFSTLKDQNVTVVLLGPDDLLNNVAPFQLASNAKSGT
jgi:hypothetical protein